MLGGRRSFTIRPNVRLRSSFQGRKFQKKRWYTEQPAQNVRIMLPKNHRSGGFRHQGDSFEFHQRIPARRWWARGPEIYSHLCTHVWGCLAFVFFVLGDWCVHLSSRPICVVACNVVPFCFKCFFISQWQLTYSRILVSGVEHSDWTFIFPWVLAFFFFFFCHFSLLVASCLFQVLFIVLLTELRHLYSFHWVWKQKNIQELAALDTPLPCLSGDLEIFPYGR